MAVITTGAHPKALWPGVAAWFGAKYAEHPMECRELFDTQPRSNKAFEEDVQEVNFGLFDVKPQGTAVTYTDHTQGWLSRYTHVAYAKGYIVTREELDDNLYKSKSFKRSAHLAFSARQTDERVAHNVYNRAFSNSYLGGDGLELCSTLHTMANGGTYSNELAVAANLSEAALEDICIQIANATDDLGNQISLKPMSLHIAPDNEFEAERILGSQLQNDTANNATNALRNKRKIPKTVVHHYFTSTTAWFVRTSCPDAMKYYPRVSLEFTRDNDFDTDNAKAKAYYRNSYGWSNPRGVYASAGV